MGFKEFDQVLDTWVQALGYGEAKGDVLRRANDVLAQEPYAPELRQLLDGSIDPAIEAVIKIDQVPTACFVSLSPNDAHGKARIEALRKAVWNQNLVCVVIAVDETSAYAYSVLPGDTRFERITPKQASACAFTYRQLVSGALVDTHPDWLDRNSRVDRLLLRNLDQAVKNLAALNVEKQRAQFLLGQVLFIAYLEHRGIAGDAYRRKYRVRTLHDLVRDKDRQGLDRYIGSLKTSFNGDFLAPEVLGLAGWHKLDDAGLAVIDDFLAHTDIASGQQSLWAYDFRFIPVELISGIYETFLSDEKRLNGAYYTPRNLAAFAVDQAFEHSIDVTQEVVYDGACGSGILLVTAFRRMMHAAEASQCEPLSFAQRRLLLLGHIRGSDLNRSACMVTAFSLYLSLLENLRPSDLTLIGGESHEDKLPKLMGDILWSGNESGDFFSPDVAEGKDLGATVFLSNPPWREPTSREKGLNYELWAADPSRRFHLPHRQIAAAFSHRALDVIPAGGRVSLILPAKLFLSETSQAFVSQFMQRCQMRRIVCFADVRFALFPKAVHPCVVVLAEKLPDDGLGDIDTLDSQDFEYWVPKADVSLAFGRLTIHSSDRHRLPIGLTARNNLALRTYLWGGPHDMALMLRLTRFGRLGDMVKARSRGKDPRWIDGKGFHHQDAHVLAPKEPGFLSKIKYLSAHSTPPIPVLHSSLLQKFPAEFTTVASYGAHGGALFAGPRVVINDGVDFESFEAKAVFSSKPFSFKSSIGAFVGPDEDEDLLRFLSVYLRSSLARYLLLVNSYALTVERQRVSMKELKSLPFVTVERHPNPEFATRIIDEIAQRTRTLEAEDSLTAFTSYEEQKPVFDRLVAQFFGLTDEEVKVVEEAAHKLIPSIQPSWSALGQTPLSRPVSDKDISVFGEVLARELIEISSKLGGAAQVRVDVITEGRGQRGGLGICRISQEEGHGQASRNGDQVKAAIAWLQEQELLPIAAGESFSLASDFLFFWRDSMYLVKPLVSRFWLHAQARRDALRVVRAARTHTRISAA